jgi:hypothetical protein
MHILSRNASYEFSKKLMSYPRALCSFLIELDVIPPFEALHSKRYKFTNTRAEVEPLTVDQVRTVVEKTQGMTRLMALLGLNAGLTQVDVSDLRPQEYEGKYLTRARSKTRKQKTRIVAYLLWDETRTALESLAQSGGERLLLTSSGTPWVTNRKDAIASI